MTGYECDWGKGESDKHEDDPGDDEASTSRKKPGISVENVENVKNI